MSLANPTRAEVFRVVWWIGSFLVCLALELQFLWLIAALIYAVVKASRWAIRVDRAQATAVDEADEIAVMRRFHEDLDGILDMIRRRGDK